MTHESTGLRKCEACHGPGPALWDPPTQRYTCKQCHSEPEDPFIRGCAVSGATFSKRCSCGAEYTAEGWEKLRYVGLQRLGAAEALELRDCERCQSTLARETTGANPRRTP